MRKGVGVESVERPKESSDVDSTSTDDSVEKLVRARGKSTRMEK